MANQIIHYQKQYKKFSKFRSKSVCGCLTHYKKIKNFIIFSQSWTAATQLNTFCGWLGSFSFIQYCGLLYLPKTQMPWIPCFHCWLLFPQPEGLALDQNHSFFSPNSSYPYNAKHGMFESDANNNFTYVIAKIFVKFDKMCNAWMCFRLNNIEIE